MPRANELPIEQAPLEVLKYRLAKWKEPLPRWLQDIAPKVIGELEAEIARRKENAS